MAVIEFLGRVDEQVKIRGFRVEPGEIEAQLRKQSGIREAAVVPQTIRQRHALDRLLHWRPRRPISKLFAPAWPRHCPITWCPAAFVKLDRLPLSPNGKLDRKALPDPDQSAFASRAFEAPKGEIEEKMAALWAELLQARTSRPPR